MGDEVIEGPVNTAAQYGDRDVKLYCTVHVTTDFGMEWYYYPDPEGNPSGQRIYDSYNDEVNDDLRDMFDVERSGEDGNGHELFTLIVKEMTKELGGDYTCRMLVYTTISATAELVAVST